MTKKIIDRHRVPSKPQIPYNFSTCQASGAQTKFQKATRVICAVCGKAVNTTNNGKLFTHSPGRAVA